MAVDAFRAVVDRFAPGSENEQYAYFREVRRHVRRGIKWLDAGCGHTLVPGWMKQASALEAELLSAPGLIVGTDLDLVSLHKPSTIQRCCCDIQKLAFRAESFDLITCNMVMEHVENPETAFREFHRVLKPGGTLIVHTPNVLNWGNFVAKITPRRFHDFVRKRASGSDPDDVFATLYRANTPQTLKLSLTGAGFETVDVQLLPGRPHMSGFGPLIYLECLMYRLSLKFPQIREILCATASKRQTELHVAEMSEEELLVGV
jgi:ubiquinone/menaquinone biosynthesis C-methylase UbiE